MDLLLAFAEFAADFEKTFADDDWSRLERHFHEDASYRVENSPFACELRGRAAILEGLKCSLDGFDRRCDSRSLGAKAQPRVDGERVIIPWGGSYRLAGMEALEISGTEVAEFRGGRISRLVDTYQEDDVHRFSEWLSRCGKSLDPSYHRPVVYHSPRTRSMRVLWLLEELGDVPCRVVEREFRIPLHGLFAQDTPTGKFPTLVDGDLVLFESGAIIQYLLDRHGRGRLQPSVTSRKRGTYYQWLHFAESTGCVPLNLIGWYGSVKRGDPRFEPVLSEMQQWAGYALGALERQLGDGPYCLGEDFSAADIMLGYTLHMATVFGVELAAFPAVQRYLSTLSERPAFKTAMAGAGAFD
jgi:glutathione S-transferase